MDTLGERLRLLMGSKRINQQRLSDATGIGRTTISHLINDKVEKPQTNTIFILAEFLDCSPTWLETGAGSMLGEEEAKEISNNIPSRKRLSYLQGSMSLKAFSKKCGIEEKVLAGYLREGRIGSDEHVYQIAKTFNTSIGWLTCGEAGQNSSRKYTGFTIDKHIETGEKLSEFNQFLDSLIIALQFSYPLQGKLSRPLNNASECRKNLSTLRSNLEENLYEDDKENWTPAVYYGPTHLKDSNKEKITNIIEHLFEFISETYTGALGANEFLDDLNLFLPQYKEWKISKKIKTKENKATGTDN